MNAFDFKTFNVGSIVRTADSCAALKHQIGFLIQVLEALDIKFSDCEQDPLLLAKAYVAGDIPIEQCKAQASVWWAKIDEKGAVRAFQDRDVLMARLAICLLSNDEDDISVLGDNLSWFFEVLGFLNVEPMKPIEMMKEYFEFK
ncbi:hypothetical protein GGD92_09130 [Pseudomonas protegens]|uniref:Uncharacterized protein n=1 Tax=Pseudomonas protegens TaxID=380021 RepID=A0A7G7XEK0_9PSED|nr:hypothetical protein [Pseudomonas protegens]QNH78395.1 hypothetical protein GGI48_04205 [Pseudomonas protegens]QNL07591.1 hypothetical protein GGD92_09130 [Pseudomonas protegens]